MAKKNQPGGKPGNGGKSGGGKPTMRPGATLTRRPPRQPGR